MTRITKFAEAFWGTDFCSTAGFDTLMKRLKDGRQMCKDFEDFLKSRAKIEEDYSKALQKLARSAGGTTEIGTLKKSYDALRQQTERVAQEHQEASFAMNESAKRMSDHMESQKNDRKHEEDNARKCTKKKFDSYKRFVDARKAYDQKCREQEQIDINVNNAKLAGISNMPAKDWEKLYNKQVKTRQELEKIDQQYRNSVDALEQARQQWEKDMTHVYNVFQHLEEGRIEFLRNEMWVHVNIMSQTYVDNDDHNEEVRRSLEQCDSKGDILLCINERKTGLERPAPIVYMPASPLPDPKSQACKQHSAQGGRGAPVPNLPDSTIMPRPQRRAHAGAGAGAVPGEDPDRDRARDRIDPYASDI